MIGNGNGIKTLVKKLYFTLIPTSSERSKFIMKHAHEFRKLGGGDFLETKELSS